jgi:hypothetical protein
MRTARERVGGWVRWRDQARGRHEMARGVGGPDGADGASWDESAGAPGEQAGQAC